MHIFNEDALLRGCANTVAQHGPVSADTVQRAHHHEKDAAETRVHYTGGNSTKQKNKSGQEWQQFFFSSLFGYVRLIH